jgi:hypothetical protein
MFSHDEIQRMMSVIADKHEDGWNAWCELQEALVSVLCNEHVKEWEFKDRSDETDWDEITAMYAIRPDYVHAKHFANLLMTNPGVIEVQFRRVGTEVYYYVNKGE